MQHRQAGNPARHDSPTRSRGTGLLAITALAGIGKYIIKVSFRGTNLGLLLMALSLFPGGVLQVWDVVRHGYWHALSLVYVGTDSVRLLEWLRLPDDLMFIFLSAVPLAIAATEAYLGVRAAPLPGFAKGPGFHFKRPAELYCRLNQ